MISSPKPNATENYSGVLPPDPSDAGITQTGSWANNPVSPFRNEILEALPACVRVQLTGSGVTALGPNQYATTLSLGETLQLTPTGADAQQNPTGAISPNVFAWTYISRNINVATVSSTGVVTAVGRGECEILVISPRQVNSSFPGAMPSGTEGVQAEIQVKVVP
jgi:hypothetical protein